MSETSEVVQRIATTLQEPNVSLLALVVEHIGDETALAILQQTLAVEAQGGMMVESRKRRRTPGGVFFQLVKEKVPFRERRKWWPGAEPPPVEARPATREEIIEATAEVLKAAGEATTVKITVVGRPGRVVERGDTILLAMESAKPPSLPKGLPEPSSEPMPYVVFIARKQWSKVSEAMRDPQDKLIVEGYPVLEKQLGAIAVYALNVTTKNLQAARRAQDKETP